MPEQAEIVQELYNRMGSLPPDKQAIVGELARRFNVVAPSRVGAQMSDATKAAALQSMRDDNPYNFQDAGGGGFWDSAKDAFSGALHGLAHLPTFAEMGPNLTAEGTKDLPAGTVGRVADQAGAGNLAGAMGTVAGTGAGLAAPALVGEGLHLAPRALGKVASALPRPGFKVQLDPAEASAVAYGHEQGVQMPTSVLTGSPIAANSEKILQHFPLASGVAKTARAAEQSTLAAAGAREVESLAPSNTYGAPVPQPLDVGEAIHQSAIANERAHSAKADDAYAVFRSIESQPEHTRTVQTGAKRVEAGLDEGGNPQFKTVPVTEDVQLPVDYRPLKAAVKPLLEETLRPMSIAQEQSSTGIKAMRNILDAPDFVSASTADQDLGALKGIMRDSPQSRSVGQAKFAADKLSAAVDEAAKRAGPDAVAALQQGREATVNKYDAQDFQRAIGFKDVGTGSVAPGEPVALVNKLTRPGDRSVNLLRSVAEQTPEHLPALAQAVTQGLLDKVTAEAGMGKPTTALTEWNKVGPQTKSILFQQPAKIQNLTDFFTLAKKLSENPNPSGSGTMLAMVKGAGLVITSPVTGIPILLGAKPLARMLFTPTGSRNLIAGLKMPAGSSAGGVLAAQILKQAGPEAQPVPASASGVSTNARAAAAQSGEAINGTEPGTSRQGSAAAPSAGASPAAGPATAGTTSGGAVGSSDTRIPVPGGTGPGYRARYRVRELDELQPSHNGLTFQPNTRYALTNDRNYSNAVNQQKIIAGASRQEFNPALHITDNPDASNGPVLTDEAGNVIGGNGRTMMLQRVNASNPKGAADYRAMLEAKAGQFGIDPASIAGMKKPVLTREIPDSEFVGPAGKQNAVTDFNKSGTASLTPAERSIADSRRVSPGTLDDISARLDAKGSDASIADILQGKAGGQVLAKLIDDGVVAPGERGSLMKGDGELTDGGKNRIEQLVLGRFFQDPAQMDSIAPTIRNQVGRIAAPLAQIEGKPDWSLTPDVREAVTILEQAQKLGIKNIDDFLRQDGLFGNTKYSEQAVTLARALKTMPAEKLKAAARQYAGDASFAAKGASMFGSDPTPAESFAEAFGGAKAPVNALSPMLADSPRAMASDGADAVPMAGDPKRLSPKFLDMHADAKSELTFNQQRITSLERNLAKSLQEKAGLSEDDPMSQVLDRNVSLFRDELRTRRARVGELKREVDVFSRPLNEVPVADSVEVGDSLASQRIHRDVISGLHDQFPELTENLADRGLVKRLIIGHELYDYANDPTVGNALGLATSKGSVYLQTADAWTKRPANRAKLWDQWGTMYFQPSAKQANLAVLLHELAHQYHRQDGAIHFSGPVPAGGDTLQGLYESAKANDRVITKYGASNKHEYFAESFVAALMHPELLAERDPAMAHFMQSFLKSRKVKTR